MDEPLNFSGKAKEFQDAWRGETQALVLVDISFLTILLTSVKNPPMTYSLTN